MISRENVESCPNCNYMLNYESERKWPDICGMCGRLTEELKILLKNEEKNGNSK